MSEASSSQPIWTPSAERSANSNLTRYLREISAKSGRDIATYDQLYDWSIDNIEDFWKSIWELAQVRHSRKFNSIVSGHEIWDARWFDGAQLNFAENMLRYDDEKPAIVAISESRPRLKITYQELQTHVADCAAGLRRLGVTRNDLVAAFIPNIPEAIIAMLATTSIGAIWSSCSPDFGFQSVLDRIGQIKPKILVAADGYVYNGKTFDSIPKINQVVEAIGSIKKVVIIPLLNSDAASKVKKSITWNELSSDNSSRLKFEQLPFDHPVYIMYSSGTTGVPKCIVHGAGGTFLQHFKELCLHTNLNRQDTITYYTTCGWMMWNWLVSSLSIGATILIYDGSPSHPDLNILWKTIEAEKISVFGTSPKFLAACQSRCLKPGKHFDLASLKTILSTGSPLAAPQYEWVYMDVKKDVQLSSITGGTDIISCFALGNPNLPVFSGEIQRRGLGMKVEAFDDNGKPLRNEVGELVCTAPFPSRPIYFWNDPENKKYKAAYFDYFPGVWRHGDFIKITERGTVIVYGRSDATLNPGGVRIGTAEIYAPLETIPEIADSLVIGQKWEDDIRIVLFVVLTEGQILSNALIDKIKSTIRENTTPRHVPAKIIQVTDIPHTINGKKVEIAVSRVVHNLEVPNIDALANPQSLEQFKTLPELKRS